MSQWKRCCHKSIEGEPLSTFPSSTATRSMWQCRLRQPSETKFIVSEGQMVLLADELQNIRVHKYATLFGILGAPAIGQLHGMRHCCCMVLHGVTSRRAR